MTNSVRLVLSDTSIMVLSSRNSLMTSIPLRKWMSVDGIHYFSQLRRQHEIDFLMSRLCKVFKEVSDESVMSRVSRVLSENMPPAPEPRPPVRTTGKKETAMVFMGGARAPLHRRGRLPVVDPARRGLPTTPRGSVYGG
jgi:hypothetical protein